MKEHLAKQKWEPGMNKNTIRESLRRALILQSFVQTGVERVVDQVRCNLL